MAAEIRLVGGISRSIPDPHERRNGVKPQIQMMVQVGKSEHLRPVPLTERKVIELVKDGAAVLELLRKERDERTPNA